MYPMLINCLWLSLKKCSQYELVSYMGMGLHLSKLWFIFIQCNFDIFTFFRSLMLPHYLRCTLDNQCNNAKVRTKSSLCTVCTMYAIYWMYQMKLHVIFTAKHLNNKPSTGMIVNFLIWTWHSSKTWTLWMGPATKRNYAFQISSIHEPTLFFQKQL